MRHPVPRFILLAVMVAATGAGAQGQKPDPGEPSSVEARVRPELAAPGASVTISGRTAIDHESRRVAITVTLPDKTTAPLQVRANEEGDFSTTFDKTAAVGEYRVQVVSPGNLSRTDTRFAVGASGAVTQALATEHEELGRTAQNAVARVSAQIATLPASPAKEEFQEKMASLKSEMARWPDESRRFRTALDALQSAARTSHGFGAIVYSDVFAPLDEWRDTSRTQRTRIQTELDRSHVVQCDRIDHAIEGLKALTLLLGLVSQPGSKIYTALGDSRVEQAARRLLAVLPQHGGDLRRTAVHPDVVLSVGHRPAPRKQVELARTEPPRQIVGPVQHDIDLRVSGAGIRFDHDERRAVG
jgi:hypothetical protein